MFDYSYRVSFLLEYGMVYLVGANTRAFPQAIQAVRYDLGPISLTNVQLMILAFPCFDDFCYKSLSKDKDGKHACCICRWRCSTIVRINVNMLSALRLRFGFQLFAECGWCSDCHAIITLPRRNRVYFGS